MTFIILNLLAKFLSILAFIIDLYVTLTLCWVSSAIIFNSY